LPTSTRAEAGKPLVRTSSSLSANGTTSSARLCRMVASFFTRFAVPHRFHAQGGNLDFLRDNRTLVISLRNQPIRFWSIPDAAAPVKPAAARSSRGKR
jgi:hypothetical protein